jgi:hypothetical protein
MLRSGGVADVIYRLLDKVMLLDNR